MKLSEKIQEALREQQEINLSDPAVQKRLAAQWGYVPADAQPAPSIKDAIIDDLQSLFDSEGITEHDSGDALIRLSAAIAAVEDNFVQLAPSVPEGWLQHAARMAALARKLREPDWHFESIREMQRELCALEEAAIAAAPKLEGE